MSGSPHLRPKVPYHACSDEDVLKWAAGFMDADGTFNTARDGASISVHLRVTQAEKGVASLHKLYDTFGGVVSLHKAATNESGDKAEDDDEGDEGEGADNGEGADEGEDADEGGEVDEVGSTSSVPATATATATVRRKNNKQHQASYTWMLNGVETVELAKVIYPYMLVKQREVEIVMRFPTLNLKHIPYVVLNIETLEMETFPSRIMCLTHIGVPTSSAKPGAAKGATEAHGSWRVSKHLTDQDVRDVIKVRQTTRDMLKHFHKQSTPPATFPDDMPLPSNAYFAGFSDGDATFDTNAKGASAQHHTIHKKHRPILDIFQRRFNGTISCVKNGSFKWTVKADAVAYLTAIVPFLAGKVAQVQLILGMQPGEAAKIHVQLRELKGNCSVPTPAIDRFHAAGGVLHTRPPRALPKYVHLQLNGKYNARVHNPADPKGYNLGVFTTQEEAEAAVAKFLPQLEVAKKSDGPTVDLMACTRRRATRTRRTRC
jgi:hypothetical protein